jgi:hypothetical protein
MADDVSVAPMSEEQAREIINRWASGGLFRLRNMGDKIFFEEIKPGVAYTLRLQTHYEQRRVRQVHEPYRGGSIDDQGRAPGRWDMRVAKPGPFEERTETMPVPHTERVEMCGTCNAQGRVTCGGCMGQGRVTCPSCGGMGFIEQQIVDQPASGQNAQPTFRTARRGCTCNGGQVMCSGCGGNGMVRCGSCAGSGQVKTFDQLVVRFLTAKEGEVIDVTPVPDKWLGSLRGDVLFDQKAPRIDGCDSVPPSVAQKANELLARSHTIDEKQDRILLQMLHIERIPLQEVTYKYAGVQRQLWICGAEQALHAPKAPWNRQRLFALIGAIVVGIVALIGLIVFLVR